MFTYLPLIIGVILLGVIVIYGAMVLYGYLLRIRSEKKYIKMRETVLRKELDIIIRQETSPQKKKELAWQGYRKFRIQKKVKHNEYVYSFYLKPHDGCTLPTFFPGQYLIFKLKMPGREEPVIRCYSLSQSPLVTDHYQITLKHLQPPKDKPDCPPGLSSSYFCQQLEEGDLLDVQAPRGRFCLDLNNQQRPIVMIAGGIGVTPLLSMLDTISASNSTLETWFFYCVRNSSEHIMKEHFEDIVKSHANIHFHIIYSHPLAQDTINKSFHYAQFFSIDLLKELLPSNSYEFFICGPSGMMKSVIKDLKAWEVPKEFIHFEAFHSASVSSAGKIKKQSDSVSAGIKIKFKRSNKTLCWDTSKSNLLELAESNGIYLSYGCRAGQCGTCSIPLISGTVEYPIEPTNQLYEDACLPCIAIPKESLELDA